MSEIVGLNEAFAFIGIFSVIGGAVFFAIWVWVNWVRIGDIEKDLAELKKDLGVDS